MVKKEAHSFCSGADYEHMGSKYNLIHPDLHSGFLIRHICQKYQTKYFIRIKGLLQTK